MKTVKVLASLAALALTAQAAQAEVVLRMASNANYSTPATVGDQVAFEWLQEQIEAETDGEVRLQIYWGSSIGSEASLIQTLETGGLDILPNSGSNLGGVIPETGLLSASYLFRDFEHYRAVVNDERFFDAWREIVEGHDLPYQFVGIGATGSRNLYNRFGEVDEPSDLTGRNMRVMASPIEFQVWSALGMTPTNIPSDEIYMALQTGVVDASESSIPFIVSNRYYEVAPYITLTNHQISTHLYFINNDSLERVPEEHRETVLRLLREAGNKQIDATMELSESMLEDLRSRPEVTVTEIDPEPFVDLLAPIQDAVAEDLGVEHVLEIVREH